MLGYIFPVICIAVLSVVPTEVGLRILCILCVVHVLPFSVTMVTGYIDLSKRRVSPEEVIKCEEKFAKAKCVS